MVISSENLFIFKELVLLSERVSKLKGTRSWENMTNLKKKKRVVSV